MLGFDEPWFYRYLSLIQSRPLRQLKLRSTPLSTSSRRVYLRLTYFCCCCARPRGYKKISNSNKNEIMVIKQTRNIINNSSFNKHLNETRNYWYNNIKCARCANDTTQLDLHHISGSSIFTIRYFTICQRIYVSV